MAHPFEVRVETPIDATPEEAWQALTTGWAMDGWFMGTNKITPGVGGSVETLLPGSPEPWASTITAWDPPHRFVYVTPESGDGRLMTFAYEIEGRGGSTILRMVHSGFLPGDDWEQEYDALKTGNPAYMQKFAQYVKYFRGRRSVPVSAFGPKIPRERTWQVFRQAMGLGATGSLGDRVHFTPDGLAPLDGVVDYVSPDFLGVRTGDGLYRFIHGFDDTIVLGHHVYADVDQAANEHAWQNWVDRLFA